MAQAQADERNNARLLCARWDEAGVPQRQSGRQLNAVATLFENSQRPTVNWERVGVTKGDSSLVD